jgi:hypothetical protein
MADFIVRLRAEPGTEAIKAIRALLKKTWRQHKLRCISIVEEKQEAPTGKPRKTLDTNYAIKGETK